MSSPGTGIESNLNKRALLVVGDASEFGYGGITANHMVVTQKAIQETPSDVHPVVLRGFGGPVSEFISGQHLIENPDAERLEIYRRLFALTDEKMSRLLADPATRGWLPVSVFLNGSAKRVAAELLGVSEEHILLPDDVWDVRFNDVIEYLQEMEIDGQMFTFRCPHCYPGGSSKEFLHHSIGSGYKNGNVEVKNGTAGGTKEWRNLREAKCKLVEKDPENRTTKGLLERIIEMDLTLGQLVTLGIVPTGRLSYLLSNLMHDKNGPWAGQTVRRYSRDFKSLYETVAGSSPAEMQIPITAPTHVWFVESNGKKSLLPSSEIDRMLNQSEEFREALARWNAKWRLFLREDEALDSINKAKEPTLIVVDGIETERLSVLEFGYGENAVVDRVHLGEAFSSPSVNSKVGGFYPLLIVNTYGEVLMEK